MNDRTKISVIILGVLIAVFLFVRSTGLNTVLHQEKMNMKKAIPSLEDGFNKAFALVKI